MLWMPPDPRGGPQNMNPTRQIPGSSRPSGLNFSLSALLAFGAGFLAGCRHTTVVQAPAPAAPTVVIEKEDHGAQAQNQVIVPEAPPPPREETVPEAPSPDQYWIPGHWEYQNGSFAWITGHYESRPHADAVYVPGHWEQRANGWVYVQGYWKQ